MEEWTIEPKQAVHHSDLVALIASIYKPKTYVELGLHHGETWNKTTPFCKNSHGVDIVDNKVEGNVFIGTTDEFFEDFNQEIDMAFIDADHSFDSCLRDFLNCHKRMARDGVILLHDTDPISDYYISPDRCGDCYKIIPIIESDFANDLNIITMPVQEAGLSIVTKKRSTRASLRNL